MWTIFDYEITNSHELNKAIYFILTRGFYIDISAHHPVYDSNTHHFYCKDGQEINIDGAPGIMEIYKPKIKVFETIPSLKP